MKLKELELANEATSEFAVSKLFECWKNKDFEEAEKYIQKTWLSSSHEDEFKNMFGGFELVDFYIYGKEVVTDCREEVDFRVDVLIRGKVKSLYGKVNTICELAPYEPSAEGQWGVNPISLLRWKK